ncbi:uncharacterized protein [Nicotiana tomentosiformis]|uniref:uncharacterized protein n=1 Tax=Nicotiana tomentosiformis TaxID=4098 RepID=UPI00388CBAE5
MILASIAPPLAQPARGGGKAAWGGGRDIRGGGKLGRGRLGGGGQPGRGRMRGGGHIVGAQPCFYAFSTRLEEQSSDAIITRIVPDFHRDASVLFDPGFTYSYVLSYFASYLDMSCDSWSAPIYVSTPAGDSIVVDHVYRSCMVSIGGYETRIVMLAMPGLPRPEWIGSMSHVPSNVVSFMNAQRMVEKGFLAYLYYVRDVSEDTPTIESVLPGGS